MFPDELVITVQIDGRGVKRTFPIALDRIFDGDEMNTDYVALIVSSLTEGLKTPIRWLLVSRALERQGEEENA
jgi:hypothetical protein